MGSPRPSHFSSVPHLNIGLEQFSLYTFTSSRIDSRSRLHSSRLTPPQAAYQLPSSKCLTSLSLPSLSHSTPPSIFMLLFVFRSLLDSNVCPRSLGMEVYHCAMFQKPLGVHFSQDSACHSHTACVAQQPLGLFHANLLCASVRPGVLSSLSFYSSHCPFRCDSHLLLPPLSLPPLSLLRSPNSRFFALPTLLQLNLETWLFSNNQCKC